MTTDSKNKNPVMAATSMLAEIDRVLSSQTVKERVDRVIGSAAPATTGYIFYVFDDDEWLQDIDKMECEDCREIHMISQHPIMGTREGIRPECEADGMQVVDVFPFNTSPWHKDEGHAADIPCDHEGCECEELFDVS